MINPIHHTSEWTTSKSAYEIKTLLLKGKTKFFTSLQPEQFEILLVCNCPKTPIEANYFNLEANICLRWECHI